MEKPKHHIFVCASTRLNGKVTGTCERKESHNLLAMINEELSDRDLEADVMVTSTGCLGLCDKGPIVIIYPEGTWYGEVAEDDIPEILDALEAGEVVESLVIA
ncbi:(2Fe-2S) ferredoxin domain-containing protein [Fusibacter paucivorans]|uniref:(2Fe-2S) ferredoxin domain-containing protein n=1 Tax=Fusibacter paucivorans TaxID=76009 RepID=A0ABS5PLC5_9FIRM|nr:(2Fe-2S) ferredoxin domain-containing protein [Fusibacter paucivorans]MBS7525968.1 (2Fe-2S) ferredoxin domain-containing protein [Fusibacter paucivorans]